MREMGERAEGGGKIGGKRSLETMTPESGRARAKKARCISEGTQRKKD